MKPASPTPSPSTSQTPEALQLRFQFDPWPCRLEIQAWVGQTHLLATRQSALLLHARGSMAHKTTKTDLRRPDEVTGPAASPTPATTTEPTRMTSSDASSGTSDQSSAETSSSSESNLPHLDAKPPLTSAESWPTLAEAPTFLRHASTHTSLEPGYLLANAASVVRWLEPIAPPT